MMRGYFSPKQARYTGTSLFRTPNGGTVKVTCVGENPPNFDDVIDRGPVTSWVETLTKPEEGAAAEEREDV